MQNKTLKELTSEGKNLFSTLAKAYAYNGIDLVMTDVVPQRGGILSEAVKEGATAYIAGGKDGQRFFDNIPQYTLPYDTFTRRTDNCAAEVVSALPQDLLKDKSALFVYLPLGNRLWSKALVEHTQTNIVATNEQNLRTYFEEKANLSDILRAAGLGQHVIPSQIIKQTRPLTEVETEALYNQYVSQDGKLVVQYCGEGNTEKGGGYSTRIITSREEFDEVCSEQRESYMKVATFISGCNSNLSICCGNLVPAQDMLGAVKNNLTDEESRFRGSTIFSMMHRCRDMGITEDKVLVSVQPGTLKVVGDPRLTSSETNGVGNQLNYNYPQETLDTIYNLGNKLGTLMALCGKVGLCGADLIITKEGHVYVNEINDRQQGPTESASLNNETYGLPGLHRTAFMMNFADLKNPQVNSYLSEVASRSREIYDEALQIPSPFYIKFISKYAGTAKQDVKFGTYVLTQDAAGAWQWHLGRDLSEQTGGDLPIVDLSEGSTAVTINSVSMKEGDFFEKENQLLRINGVSIPGSMPFGINEEGKSILTKEWVEPIEALYDQLMEPQVQVEEVVEDQDVAKVEETEAVATIDPEKLDYIAQIASIINRHTQVAGSQDSCQDDGGQAMN